MEKLYIPIIMAVFLFVSPALAEDEDKHQTVIFNEKTAVVTSDHVDVPIRTDNAVCAGSCNDEGIRVGISTHRYTVFHVEEEDGRNTFKLTKMNPKFNLLSKESEQFTEAEKIRVQLPKDLGSFLSIELAVTYSNGESVIDEQKMRLYLIQDKDSGSFKVVSFLEFKIRQIEHYPEPLRTECLKTPKTCSLLFDEDNITTSEFK